MNLLFESEIWVRLGVTVLLVAITMITLEKRVQSVIEVELVSASNSPDNGKNGMPFLAHSSTSK